MSVMVTDKENTVKSYGHGFYSVNVVYEAADVFGTAVLEKDFIVMVLVPSGQKNSETEKMVAQEVFQELERQHPEKFARFDVGMQQLDEDNETVHFNLKSIKLARSGKPIFGNGFSVANL